MDARGVEEGPRSQFWLMSMRCCLMAGSVDIAFFFIFHYLGSPILAWVNVASVAMYAVAYFALKRRRNRLAVLLIWLEVLGHSALGTLLVGWHSGFHYYLLMFIPALFAGTRSVRWAGISVFCLWLFYIALSFTMRVVDPIQPIPANALAGLHLFNLTVVFIMFSYLSVYYMMTVKQAHRVLRRMATTDPLTRLFNRRHMIELAARDISGNDRHSPQLAILLMDVDHFKQLNDRFGHDLGDRVLCELSSVIKDAVREKDYVGRWGGEEFLAVLPDSDSSQAGMIAERVRAAVDEFDWSRLGLDTAVTLSIGVSHLVPGESFNECVARADSALYISKDSGRNRVSIASCIELSSKSDYAASSAV
ncbi:diguanylate cyclase [Halopseudomonas nanhaiensis]|uniref:GGDEF domain-containing protein n=1 Tax=Halopseudomonas nanhaiensis TaxID=2830842 RepID=UPI001CBF5EB9|nr:GGDEF domain-containing protein [Halopseudomonas nanhaiensis]UAW99586.1 diguanylate cyclase [Halopseudomonas nanhaiensis]